MIGVVVGDKDVVDLLDFGALVRDGSSSNISLAVLAATCALEFLQLWHPVWLERIRSTFIGRCLLGTTFGWSDFPPYFLGAVIGWALLRILKRLMNNRANIHA